MDTNKNINKVFELYSQERFNEAQELNNKIIEEFPSNMYAKRYEKILADKVSNNTSKNNRKAKAGGKTIKCPHCLAKIPFSGLTKNQRDEIKKGKYNNLEIKCTYCNTKFILQKKKAKSVLSLKIGDTANIEGIKYRATGYVEYSGKWFEGRYSDVTKYLEWILLGEDNSYYYFSEGYSLDEGSSEEEYELSKKIIPNFGIPSKFNARSEVTVKSIYGENSKNYVVGEKTILYEFSKNGKEYIKEVEGVGSQKEAGIYEAKSISRNEALSIFGKTNINYISNGNRSKKSVSGDIWGWITLAFIFGVNFISLLSWTIIIYGIGLIVLGTLYYFYKDKIPDKYSNIIYLIIALPIFSLLIFKPIFNSILENKEKINIPQLDKVNKAELKFKDISIMKEKVTSINSYTAGGTKTNYSKNIGLKFSVKNDEDKKIIEKIKDLDSENEIKKMFDGDLYKLK